MKIIEAIEEISHVSTQYPFLSINIRHFLQSIGGGGETTKLLTSEFDRNHIDSQN